MGEDGNVTAALVPHKPFTAAHLKSIYLSAAVVDSSFHTAVCDICLLKGYRLVHVPNHIAYVAHNRMYRNNDKKKVCVSANNAIIDIADSGAANIMCCGER